MLSTVGDDSTCTTSSVHQRFLPVSDHPASVLPVPMCVSVDDDEDEMASNIREDAGPDVTGFPSTSSSSSLLSKTAHLSVTSSMTSLGNNSNLVASVSSASTATVSCVTRQVSLPVVRFKGSSSRDSVIVDVIHPVDETTKTTDVQPTSPRSTDSSQPGSLMTTTPFQTPSTAVQRQPPASIGRTNFSISNILGPVAAAERHQKTLPYKRHHQLTDGSTTEGRNGVDAISKLSSFSPPAAAESQSKSPSRSLSQSCIDDCDNWRRQNAHRRAVATDNDDVDEDGDNDNEHRSSSLASRRINERSTQQPPASHELSSHPGPLQLPSAGGGLSEAVRHLIERQLLAGKVAAAAMAAATGAAAVRTESDRDSLPSSAAGDAGIWHPPSSAVSSWLHHQLPVSILHRRLLADIAAGQFIF